MSDIEMFPGITSLDWTPNVLLEHIKGANLELCIVIGVDKDGAFYFKSSKADGGEVLWWLEMAKKKLLEVGDERKPRACR